VENQNVTLSLPKDILQKAKHGRVYGNAKSRQLAVMSSGLDLGLGFGIAKNVPWKRDDLHAR
jgi:hypothetical protein